MRAAAVRPAVQPAAAAKAPPPSPAAAAGWEAVGDDGRAYRQFTTRESKWKRRRGERRAAVSRRQTAPDGRVYFYNRRTTRRTAGGDGGGTPPPPGDEEGGTAAVGAWGRGARASCRRRRCERGRHRLFYWHFRRCRRWFGGSQGEATTAELTRAERAKDGRSAAGAAAGGAGRTGRRTTREEGGGDARAVLQGAEKAAAHKEHKAARKAVTDVLDRVLQQVERSCTEMVTEVDGLTLHLSQRNSATGYKGVSKNGKRYDAESKGFKIGRFATAVEAAVAYARHEEVRAVLDGVIDQVAGGGPSRRGPRSEPLVEPEPPMTAEEALAAAAAEG